MSQGNPAPDYQPPNMYPAYAYVTVNGKCPICTLIRRYVYPQLEEGPTCNISGSLCTPNERGFYLYPPHGPVFSPLQGVLPVTYQAVCVPPMQEGPICTLLMGLCSRHWKGSHLYPYQAAFVPAMKEDPTCTLIKRSVYSPAEGDHTCTFLWACVPAIGRDPTCTLFRRPLYPQWKSIPPVPLSTGLCTHLWKRVLLPVPSSEACEPASGRDWEPSSPARLTKVPELGLLTTPTFKC